MKSPSRLLALTLLALLPVLSACGAKDEAASTAADTAATATSPAEVASTTEAAAAAAPATETAPASLVSATPPTGPQPVAGTDYIVIDNGQPYAPGDGKIEVAEVFGYTCPHCAQFEPLINSWKRKQPADVRVTAVPAAFGGYWVTYARAFFAAETLGVLDKSHDAMFNALHVQRSLDLNATPEQIGEFYAKYGVDAKTFASTMASFGVETKLNRAKQFAVRSKVEGTPSIVVDGKYLVSIDQRGYDAMFNTVEHLVAGERAALAGAAK
ncbi:MAG TPA: thiol:disulfide interchange protein DsbA/DsbL [Pseudoxanthomonas sp.]|nr:thiol:disulfide interchange protein DsbA/DsbL [Pseudoxanthomonas sp.]